MVRIEDAMKIAFDMDGVLSKFDDSFVDVLNSIYGEGIFVKTEPTTWHWTEPIVAGSEKAGFAKLKTIPNFWLSLAPYEKNVREANAAVEENPWHDYYIVTARSRSAGDTITSQTRQWLDKYAPSLSLAASIIAVDKPALKRQVLEGIGIEAMIDDYGPTVEDFDTMPNFKGYLINHGWNQDAKVKNRVNSVQEFLEAIGCLKLQRA